jgi:hypothetical protein
MSAIEGLAIFHENMKLLVEAEPTVHLIGNAYALRVHGLSGYIAFNYTDNILPAVFWTLTKIKEVKNLNTEENNFALLELQGTVDKCTIPILNGIARLANAKSYMAYSEGLHKLLENYGQAHPAPPPNLLNEIKEKKALATPRIQPSKSKKGELKQQPQIFLRSEEAIMAQKKVLKPSKVVQQPPREDALISELRVAFNRIRGQLESSLIESVDLSRSFCIEEEANNPQSN